MADIRRGGACLRRRRSAVRGHAAVDHGALAYDAACKAQHFHRARYRFDGLPIERAEDIEGGPTPFDEMVSMVTGPADEIRHYGKRQRRGKVVDTIDLSLVD